MNTAAIDTLGKSLTISLSEICFIELVWIPQGSFTMGSPAAVKRFVRTGGFFKNFFHSALDIVADAELGREPFADEPQRPVTIHAGFWLGKYPITYEQWAASIQLDSSTPQKSQKTPLKCPKPLSPQQTSVLCQTLNASKAFPYGWHCTLPTEQQWEYACRADTTTALNSGKNLSALKEKCTELDAVGWYSKNSTGRSHPVGQKAPNAWGLYDMHGNLAEWCFQSKTPNELEDKRSDKQIQIVARGGAYNSEAGECRAAASYALNEMEHPAAAHSNYPIGYRLCLCAS